MLVAIPFMPRCQVGEPQPPLWDTLLIHGIMPVVYSQMQIHVMRSWMAAIKARRQLRVHFPL